ncbi:MAG: DUF2191 domain-containing protein [Polyangiales bacterium]
MKTTVEIADALFDEAKVVAASAGLSMRALIEEGLRSVVQARRRPPQPFRLRDGSFGGSGRSPEFQHASWSQIQAAIERDSKT